MPTRSRPRRSDDEPRGRRHRYQKKTNTIGIVVFLLVLGGLAAAASILYKNVRNLPGASDADVEETEWPRGKAPPRPAPAGRPAPELRGDLIIEADRLFRLAKDADAAARAAEAAGDHALHDKRAAECREHLRALDALLQPFTRWHAEAKGAGWEIPKQYETLERRVEKYAQLARE